LPKPRLAPRDSMIIPADLFDQVRRNAFREVDDAF